MRTKLFSPSFPSLGAPSASADLKIGSLGAVLELLLVTSSPLVSSKHLSASGMGTCKLHLFLNRRPFSTIQAKLPSGRDFFGIGRAVISRCSFVSKKKTDSLLDDYSSLPEILKKYGSLCPEITRRFWRVSTLRPGDFLELLMSFEPGKDSIFIAEFLWMLFRWAPRQSRHFHHLPRSYEMMISMLIRSRMLADAESLLLSSVPNGTSIFSNPSEIFSDIIQGYAENFLLQNAVALYNQARNQGLELSCSCYRALLNLLVEDDNSDLAIRVYMDMMESEFGSCAAEDWQVNFVVGSLSKNGKTIEAVNILRRTMTAGVKASPTILDAVVQGYCCKKDYEDVLNFMKEWAHIPFSSVGNKVVSSICKKIGSDYAWFFTQELKALGFQLDDISFGILIVQSCKERKLRDAFIYLSESFSHRIKLNVHAYNAIIGGVSKEGMCEAAKNIFEEMVERDILLDLSTLKILLAGYCKHRKFLEIKNLLVQMEKSGFSSLAQGEDPLSKAIKILGLDCLGVKVKRDNDASVPKAEYFDSLGNGLYLETDNCEYEKILDKILDDAMIPDFDSLLFKECQQGNLDRALGVKNEVVQWGHDLSPQTCSQFLKAMCNSSSHLKEAISFLDEEPELWDRLDGSTLNLVVQSLSKNGMTVSARSVLDRLLKRELLVDNATCNAVILGFYKEKNLRRIKEYLELLEGIIYSPCSKDIDILVSCLCKSGMVEEMLMFFDSMTEKYHNLGPSFVTAILKELSSRGLSSIGTVFLEEVFKRTPAVDHAFLRNLTETACIKSYQFLLHFLMSSGRTEETLFLKQHALSKRGNHTNSVYSLLLNEFCMLGKLREATSQLQEMLANGVFPDDKILNAFVLGFCRQNNLKKALEILAIMLRTRANLSISSYRCLVRRLCVHRLLKGALNLQKLIQVENVSKTLIFQNILIFSLFQTKNYLLVDALLENMQEKHLLRDTNTCNFLVYGYCKYGIASKAVEVFYDMICHGMRPNNRSFRTIICYFCGRGELNKALELSNMMLNHGWKIGSCIQNSLAMSLISSGQLSEALFLLDQIEEQGLIPERVHYDLLIKELSVQSKLKKAVHLLNLMLKKGSLPSQTSYISVIHGLCIHKAFDEALDFYEEMFHKGLVPSEAFSDTLICDLTECGRTDDARRILGIMLQFGLVPASSMYNYVIRSYHTENNMEKASEILQEMQKAGHSPNFETHWSLISSLSSTALKENHNKGFLSSLLSADGLLVKNRKGKANVYLPFKQF